MQLALLHNGRKARGYQFHAGCFFLKCQIKEKKEKERKKSIVISSETWTRLPIEAADGHAHIKRQF